MDFSKWSKTSTFRYDSALCSSFSSFSSWHNESWNIIILFNSDEFPKHWWSKQWSVEEWRSRNVGAMELDFRRFTMTFSNDEQQYTGTSKYFYFRIFGLRMFQNTWVPKFKVMAPLYKSLSLFKDDHVAYYVVILEIWKCRLLRYYPGLIKWQTLVVPTGRARRHRHTLIEVLAIVDRPRWRHSLCCWERASFSSIKNMVFIRKRNIK